MSALGIFFTWILEPCWLRRRQPPSNWPNRNGYGESNLQASPFEVSFIKYYSLQALKYSGNVELPSFIIIINWDLAS
jgi:hypothetical protein